LLSIIDTPVTQWSSDVELHMAISARWKAGGSFLSPREQMDCNGESDRKGDEPWQQGRQLHFRPCLFGAPPQVRVSVHVPQDSGRRKRRTSALRWACAAPECGNGRGNGYTEPCPCSG
jgi:hypothetical protein